MYTLITLCELRAVLGIRQILELRHWAGRTPSVQRWTLWSFPHGFSERLVQPNQPFTPSQKISVVAYLFKLQKVFQIHSPSSHSLLKNSGLPAFLCYTTTASLKQRWLCNLPTHSLSMPSALKMGFGKSVSNLHYLLYLNSECTWTEQLFWSFTACWSIKKAYL